MIGPCVDDVVLVEASSPPWRRPSRSPWSARRRSPGPARTRASATGAGASAREPLRPEIPSGIPGGIWMFRNALEARHEVGSSLAALADEGLRRALLRAGPAVGRLRSTRS